MADALFDYDNLVITIPSGDTDVDVEKDLYSAWKRSQLAQDDPETGAYPAFRTTGGDPLTPGIDAGAYFFLRNDLGWRIKGPEEDTTIYVVGNLAPEDSSLPILIPTTGNYSVMFLGLQPITQNVDTLLTGQQHASYGGRVVIDVTSGNSGTTYPTGLYDTPVDNLTDALAILQIVGGTELVVEGTLTLDQTIPLGTTIRGSDSSVHDTVRLNGQTVNKVVFHNIEIQGIATTGSAVECFLCSMDSVEGIQGTFRQCGFQNSYKLCNGTYVFAYCYSEVAGTAKPLFDCDGDLGDVSFRAWTGGLDVINHSNPASNMTIDAISASVRLQSSCTAGNIVCRGVGELIDQSAGTNVTDNGWVEGGQLFTDVLDEPNSIETGLTMREALRLILAATAGKLTGAETTTVAIRNAVADSKDRITATVDANGNRTAVTYDVTD